MYSKNRGIVALNTRMGVFVTSLTDSRHVSVKVVALRQSTYNVQWNMHASVFLAHSKQFLRLNDWDDYGKLLGFGHLLVFSDNVSHFCVVGNLQKRIKLGKQGRDECWKSGVCRGKKQQKFFRVEGLRCWCPLHCLISFSTWKRKKDKNQLDFGKSNCKKRRRILSQYLLFSCRILLAWHQCNQLFKSTSTRNGPKSYAPPFCTKLYALPCCWMIDWMIDVRCLQLFPFFPEEPFYLRSLIVFSYWGLVSCTWVG